MIINSDKSAIRWMVEREHVSTPLYEIGRDISRVLDSSLPRLYRANAIRYARQCHRDNRELFRLKRFWG